MSDTGQVIHIDANKLIMSATIFHSNIWLGFVGIESHVHARIHEEFMPSVSTGLKSMEGLLDDDE